MGFVADAKSDGPLRIDMPVERDSDVVADWLKWYVECLGVEVVATDDLSTHKPVVGKLRLGASDMRYACEEEYG